MSAEIAILSAMRTDGWAVAVHNDYRLAGKPHTFYLFTHPCGVWAKGEGATDYDALMAAREDAGLRMKHFFPGQ